MRVEEGGRERKRVGVREQRQSGRERRGAESVGMREERKRGCERGEIE